MNCERVGVKSGIQTDSQRKNRNLQDGEIKNTHKGDVLLETVSECSNIGSTFREVACYY